MSWWAREKNSDPPGSQLTASMWICAFEMSATLLGQHCPKFGGIARFRFIYVTLVLAWNACAVFRGLQ